MDLAKKVVKGETVPARVVTEETTFTQEQAKTALPNRASTDRTAPRGASGVMYPGPERLRALRLESPELGAPRACGLPLTLRPPGRVLDPRSFRSPAPGVSGSRLSGSGCPSLGARILRLEAGRVVEEGPLVGCVKRVGGQEGRPVKKERDVVMAVPEPILRMTGIGKQFPG
ncbi:hypothetical protein [Nonomuraea dietziae]|uniref:hypothetical protein n=1 Tax=Nonomuraea dietziae TaxID=65515 RepID=UPI0031D3A7D0